jgi:hypothetical protein
MDGDIAATEEDLHFLKKVRKDASRPIIFRCKAAFTRGYCSWAANLDREEAARSYRQCINIGDAATPEELNSAVMMIRHTTAGRLEATRVEPLLVNALKQSYLV